jgi:hypothetical protein
VRPVFRVVRERSELKRNSEPRVVGLVGCDIKLRCGALTLCYASAPLGLFSVLPNKGWDVGDERKLISRDVA